MLKAFQSLPNEEKKEEKADVPQSSVFGNNKPAQNQDKSDSEEGCDQQKNKSENPPLDTI